MHTKYIIVFMLLSVSFLSLYGNDNIHIDVKGDVSYMTASDYDISYNDRNVESGKFSEVVKVKMNVSAMLLKNNNINMSIGVGCNYYRIGLETPEMICDDLMLNLGNDHMVYGPNVNMTFRGLFFNRKINGNVHLKCDFSEYGFEKVTGFAVVSTPVVQNNRIYIGIGVIGLINTTSPFPVFPFIMMRYKFSDKLTLDVMPPQFSLRYMMPKYGSTLTLGLSIDGEHFYLRPGNETLPRKCVYSRSMINPEIGYTKNIGKEISLTLKSGMNIMMSNNVYKRTGTSKLVDISQSLCGYVSVGIRYRFN